MGLPSLFDESIAVRGALIADLHGRPLGAPEGSPPLTEKHGAATAAAVREFAEAGNAVGFARLESVAVRGAGQAVLTAVHPDALVTAVVDGSASLPKLEKALRSWTRTPSRAPEPDFGSMTPPPIPLTRAVPAPASDAAPDPLGWTSLRRALVRGQLTQAVAIQRSLREVSPGDAREPGAEPLEARELDRSMRVLLDGIGSVMAGDTVGGGRILLPMVAPAQPNLSFRWLALHWSSRAALQSGAAAAARPHVKESLHAAKKLDADAKAVSQWTAGELLAFGNDPSQALPWLRNARALFARLADGWGTGRTWMTEARILAALQREDECVRAAQQAWTADTSWDEPPLFLATRALQRNDLAAAESFSRAVESPAAGRFCSLIEAVRSGALSQSDACAFLEEKGGHPSLKAVRVLERIAEAAPDFIQARETLAWMLVRLGKYGAAEPAFRNLLDRPLSPGERDSVLLGLDCVAQAVRLAKEADPGGASGPRAAGSPSPEPQPASASAVLPGGPAWGNGPPSAVFSGRLSAFALPDLLEFLRSARRTGLLLCRSAAGMGSLHFRDGRIAAGSSPGTPKLGEILVRDRAISPVALRSLGTAEGEDFALGALLVREGAVDASAVKRALCQQIEATMRELFHWRDGEFAFNREAESPDAQSPVAVDLDPQAVLLDLLKELDEASRTSTASGGAR